MSAATKSSNKNTKKRFNIRSWSRRKQTSVFILLFAIVGGGVLVFNSFAASVIEQYNSDSFQNLKLSAYGQIQNGKSSIWVWQMSPKGLITSPQNVNLPANTTYQMCFYVKGVGSINATMSGASSIGLTNSTAFQSYCGPISGPNSTPIVTGMAVFNTGTSTIYLSSVTIQAASQGQTVAPGK